jgi:hypothetical protein
MFLACCEQVRASSMLACSIPECSRRFCEVILLQDTCVCVCMCVCMCVCVCIT